MRYCSHPFDPATCPHCRLDEFREIHDELYLELYGTPYTQAAAHVAALTAERDGLRRNNEVLRDVLMDAENALAHSYDVLEWPGDTSNQYDVLMKVRKVLGRDQAQEETRV